MSDYQSDKDNHTAKDPTISEASNTAKEPASDQDKTAKEPGCATERHNRTRIQQELEGPVQESSCQQQYCNEEYDMTTVMFKRQHVDPATAEAEAARKKKSEK